MFVFVYLSLVVCEGNVCLSIKLELVLKENRPENVNELTRHTYSHTSQHLLYIHTYNSRHARQVQSQQHPG